MLLRVLICLFSQFYVDFTFYVVRFFVLKFYSILCVVVFLARVFGLNPCMYNSACTRRLNYAYASLFMCTQAWSMRTHTTSLHTQAYVCTRILVPRNPNSSFLLLFLLLFYIICLSFNLLVCFWVIYFSIHMFVCYYMLD